MMKKIATFWPSADCLKKSDPVAFVAATDVLADSCASLADSSVTASKEKTLLVFQSNN
ncbi:hypothetical protein [Burkholderia anthina]|uniref:hypothetical protein n=1 Tax=Burkholderia anthina TaxID=179879 RepID=UPI001AA08027|nr:hypothetical protein [Burkholderia anthina]QTD92430.1 hypothetical protein J4G50_29840 [Burkholderia anthina]